MVRCGRPLKPFCVGFLTRAWCGRILGALAHNGLRLLIRHPELARDHAALCSLRHFLVEHREQGRRHSRTELLPIIRLGRAAILELLGDAHALAVAVEGDRAALRQEVCAMLEPIVAGHPFYALTLGFLECPAVQLVMRGTDLREVKHVRQPARLRLPKLSQLQLDDLLLLSGLQGQDVHAHEAGPVHRALVHVPAIVGGHHGQSKNAIRSQSGSN